MQWPFLTKEQVSLLGSILNNCQDIFRVEIGQLFIKVAQDTPQLAEGRNAQM
jgi:hypothetical protein